ncbi:MAG: MFS transporter [Nitratireductor sp.]|nr:MFS transporter [Nitratireductor sp.]
MLLSSLGVSIANIALPAIAADFGLPLAAVQWTVTAYLITLTGAVLVAGGLGDRFGLRKMYLIGLGLFAAASLACGLAGDLRALVAGRALAGMAAAFLTTLPVAIVRGTVSQNRVGAMMGLLGTVSAIGTALGPSAGGMVIAGWNWHGVFWILSLLAVANLGLALASLPAPSPSVSAAPASTSAERTPSLAQLAMRAAPSLAINFCVASVMMTTLVAGPFYLSIAAGLGVAKVGLVMAIGPVTSMLAGVPSGRLTDAYGAEPVLKAGLASLIGGAVAMALLPGAFGVVGYVGAMLVLTPGYQLFQAANNTAVVASAGESERGRVSGLLALSRNLGLVFGAGVMGAVFALAAGAASVETASAASIADAMRLTFLLAASLLAVVVVAVRSLRGRLDGLWPNSWRGGGG